jgi:arylsulfatase A-like enzyme
MNVKRNVIFLTIDSLRADHLGCLGYSKDITPNIDKLANEGALFSQAISNGDVTKTSFPSIITSSYASLHPERKVVTKGQPHRWLLLSSDRTTIAEVLKKNEYSTVAFIARNPWISSYFHYDRGFNVFDDQLFHGMPYYWKPTETASFIGIKCKKIFLRLNRSIRAWKTILGVGSERANAINSKAISWLRKNSSCFFLWLHYMDVHQPYNANTFMKRIKAFSLDKKILMSRKTHTHMLTRNELDIWINLYDNAINRLDHEIGSFLYELEKEGISHDESYIIVVADHGEQFMEHGWIGHGSLYDEVLHVPLIICGPGIERKIVIKDQVPLLDVGPTIIDLLHIPKVNNFQGKSLLPLIKKKDNAKRDIISEGLNPLINKSKAYSFRTGEWKYIFTLDEGKKELKAELYNLHTDPGEKENLIEIEKTRAEEFRLNILNHITKQEKEHFMTKETVETEVYNIEDRIKIEERLKDLGYI